MANKVVVGGGKASLPIEGETPMPIVEISLQFCFVCFNHCFRSQIMVLGLITSYATPHEHS